jgi:hypothetical protein
VTHGMRQLLDEELADEFSPPLGDLVRHAIDQGEHLRFRRRTGRLAGAAAAVVAGGTALAVVIGLAGGGAGAGPDSYGKQPAVSVSAGSPAPSPLLARDGLVFASPSPVGEAQRVPATWAGSLELLDRLLSGRRSAQAWGEGDGTAGATMVQTYVDKGQGPGMLRLSVGRFGGPPVVCAAYQRCYQVPGVGRVALEGLEDNCVQTRIVSLLREDGVYLQLNMGTCLAWDGTRNPEGRLVLTDQEAIDLVLDPRWGLRMSAELVSAGAARFASAPRISGG